jgi:hypothetical protein
MLMPFANVVRELQVPLDEYQHDVTLDRIAHLLGSPETVGSHGPVMFALAHP